MIKKSTQELLEILTSGVKISEYYAKYQNELYDMELSDYLEILLKKKQLKKADVIKNAQLERTYGYQLFNGTRTPSRNSLSCIGFGMELNLDEMQILLKVAHHAPLYARDLRDSAIIYGINKKYNMTKIEELLLELEYAGLCTKADIAFSK